MRDRLADHFALLQQGDGARTRHRLQKVARELRHALARDFVHARLYVREVSVNRVVFGRFGIARFGVVRREILFAIVLVDQLHRGHDRIVLVNVDDANSLRVAADRTDVGDVRADDHSLLGNEQHLIVFEDVRNAGNLAVLVGRLDVRDADAAARLQAIRGNGRTLAETFFGDGEDLAALVGSDDFRIVGLRLRFDHLRLFAFGGRLGHGLAGRGQHVHLDDVIAFAKRDAFHAGGAAAHGADAVFIEADGHAVVRADEDLIVPLRQADGVEIVAFVDVDGDDAGGANVRKRRQLRLLDLAGARDHDHVLRVVEIADGEQRANALILLDSQQVDDRLPARVRRNLGDLVHLDPVQASAVSEDEDVRMRAGDEEVLDDVLFLRLHADAAFAAAALRAIQRQRRALDVAAARHGDDHVLVGDHVLDGDVAGLRHDLGAAFVAVRFLDLAQLGADDAEDERLGTEDFAKAADRRLHLFVLGHDLLALQTGEALQTHVENRLRLHVAELPAFDQTALRFLRRAAGADERDQFVDDVERFDQTFEDVGAFLRFAKIETSPADDDLFAMLDEVVEQRREVHDLRLVVDDGQEDDAERGLHLGVAIQIAQHDLGDRIALQFDDDAHSFAVGFVAKIGNTFNALVVNELRDLLEQALFVRHVRDFRHDDLFALAPLLRFDRSLSANLNDSAAGVVRLVNAFNAENEAGGREIGAGHHRHQLFH